MVRNKLVGVATFLAPLTHYAARRALVALFPVAFPATSFPLPSPRDVCGGPEDTPADLSEGSMTARHTPCTIWQIVSIANLHKPRSTVMPETKPDGAARHIMNNGPPAQTRVNSTIETTLLLQICNRLEMREHKRLQMSEVLRIIATEWYAANNQ